MHRHIPIASIVPTCQSVRYWQWPERYFDITTFLITFLRSSFFRWGYFFSTAGSFDSDRDELKGQFSEKKTDSGKRGNHIIKINSHILKRQKINQAIIRLELEINLLRTRQNNMNARDYQKKLS
ncbi:hypothetical protein S079_19725 [Salmonella enterica subsp. enterica]|nr:hypothetical protein [Salmonella enterica subsp. enterica]MIH62642.1 hypothetical protein [Salmonella enterica subsp. enterica]